MRVCPMSHEIRLRQVEFVLDFPLVALVLEEQHAKINMDDSCIGEDRRSRYGGVICDQAGRLTNQLDFPMAHLFAGIINDIHKMLSWEWEVHISHILHEENGVVDFMPKCGA
ncbi:hypothetical protein RIF29_38985 [Crotalaria pallida]|uniref:Uncharacterized protein n=1 Tax=Crotalaria pallida TaxID=3830 RepID=A0AAN9E2U2_CROPI